MVTKGGSPDFQAGHEDVRAALSRGQALLEAGHHRDAAEALDQAAKDGERLGLANGNIWSALARAYQGLHDFAKARDALGKAVAGLKQDRAGAIAIARCEARLAEVEWELGDLVLAEQHLKAPIRAFAKHRVQCEADLAASYLLLGKIQLALSRPAAAIETLRKCLALDAATDREIGLRAELALANAQQDSSRFLVAEASYQALEPKCQGNADILSGLYNSWGILCDRTGEWARARTLYDRAIVEKARVLKSDPTPFKRAVLVRIMSNFIVLLGMLGDFATAQRLIRRGRRLLPGIVSVGDRDMLLLADATVAGMMGNFRKAIKRHRQLIASWTEEYGADCATILTIQTELAQELWGIGKHAEAIAELEKALQAPLSDSGLIERLGVQEQLAAMLVDAGRLDDAEAVIRDALVNEAAIGMKEGRWRIFGTLARYAAQRNLRSAAILFGKISVSVIQQMSSELARVNDAGANMFRASRKKPLRVLIDGLIDLGRLPEAGYVREIERESMLFNATRCDASLDPRTTTIGSTSDEARLVTEFERQADALHRAASTAETGNRRRRKTADRKQLEKALLGWMDKALAESWRTRATYTPPPPVGEADTLSPGAARLRYIEGEASLVIAVRTADTEKTVEIPGAPSARNKLIHEFRDAIVTRDPEAVELARQLYDELVLPIEPLLVDCSRLELSLDGSLRYLPFAALYDGSTYIVRRWSTVTRTAAVALHRPVPNRATWKTCGVGTTKAWHRFGALPYVRAELEQIAALRTCQPLLDEEFTAAGFAAALKSTPQILHIASHFSLDPAQVHRSRMLLGDGTLLSLEELRAAEYDFSTLELLVLSACDSGMAATGDHGLESFAGLAQMKGARRVLATLWPVSDSSSALLVSKFYEVAFGEPDIDLAEALQRAQCRMLTAPMTPLTTGASSRGGLGIAGPMYDMSHPYYWAGYALFEGR